MNCMVFNEGSAYPETSNNHQNREDVGILTGSVCPAQQGWWVALQHFLDGVRSGNINILRATFCLGKAGAVGMALSG